MSSSEADGDAGALLEVALLGLDVVDGDEDRLADELLPQELLGLVGPEGLLRVARPVDSRPQNRQLSMEYIQRRGVREDGKRTEVHERS